MVLVGMLMKIQLDNQELSQAVIEYVLNNYNVPYSKQLAVTITAQNNNFTAVVDTEPPKRQA